MVGFLTRATAVTLVAGAVAGAQSRDTTQLLPVVVTATRTARPHGTGVATTTTIDTRALRERGVADVAEVLRTVPGLHLVRSGGPGAPVSMFMRGAESDYVRVLVDGVPVNEPGGAVDLAAWTLDGIDRIEVVRGPASVLYGSDAVAGVVQLFTRRPGEGASASLQATGASYGGRAVDVAPGLAADRWSVAGGAGRRSSDGIHAFNSAWWNEAWHARAALRGGRWSAAATVQQRRDEQHYPTDGTGRVVDVNAVRRGRRTTVGADVSADLHAGLRFLANASALEGRGLTDDPRDGAADSLGLYAYLNRGSVRRRGVEGRLEWEVRPGILTAVGGEWQLEAQRSRDSSNFGGSPAFAARRETRAVFAQVAGGTSRVQFMAGARHDHNTVFGDFATGRAGATVDLAAGFRVRASHGTSFKAPGMLEQFATAFTAGNRDLRPERGRVTEMGVTYAPGGALEWSATAFRQRFQDLIQYTFRDAGPDYFNVARARSDGVEVTGRWRVDGAWHLDVMSTWLATEVLDAGFDSGEGAVFVAGNRLLRRPSNTASVGATYTPSAVWSGNVTITRIGARDDRDFSTFPAAPRTLAPWARVDFAASRDIGRGLVALVRVENLLGHTYQEVYGFAAPRRVVTAGVRVTRGGA